MSIANDFLKRFLDLIDDMECKRYKVPKKIGIGYSTFTRMIKQNEMPMVATLVKIADYFNISVEYLIGRTEDESFEPAKAPVTFHERVEELRQEENVTSYALAMSLYLAPNFFTEWKRNKHIPNIDNLILIADHFKVSVDYLLGRTDNK